MDGPDRWFDAQLDQNTLDGIYSRRSGKSGMKKLCPNF